MLAYAAYRMPHSLEEYQYGSEMALIAHPNHVTPYLEKF